MLRALAFALVLLPALVSCSSSDSDPEPTSDIARYHIDQVKAIARGERIACTSWTYAGKGIWECGPKSRISATFDERTGTVAGQRVATPRPR